MAGIAVSDTAWCVIGTADMGIGTAAGIAIAGRALGITAALFTAPTSIIALIAGRAFIMAGRAFFGGGLYADGGSAGVSHGTGGVERGLSACAGRDTEDFIEQGSGAGGTYADPQK